jgi:sugar lactone lactonase YvrE
MAHDRRTLKHCGCTTYVSTIQLFRKSRRSKLFLLSLAVAFTLVVANASAAEVETIVLFNPEIPETPESIQVDRHGNIYVSLSRIAEVRKISPKGRQSTLAILCPASTTRTAGIALDERTNVYVVVNSCPTTGAPAIWQITPRGRQWLVANLPPTSRLNGIAYQDGWLYAADSRLGQVWRVHSDGQSPAEVWSADPLLQHPPNPEPGIPGPNGLQVFDDEVYVSVSTRDHIVALPINEDGSAGPGRVHVMFGADDFAFDKIGNLYATTNFDQRVVRVTPAGMTQNLLTGDDGLDGPTSAAFGVKNHKKDLYVANGALPQFPGPNPRRPSIMRLHIGIKGEPRP